LGIEIKAYKATLRSIIDQRPFENAKRRVTSYNFADVSLRLANGAIASMTFSAVASGPDEPTTLTIHGEEGAMRLVGEELLTAMRGEPFTAATKASRSDRRGNSAGGAFGTGTYFLGRALKSAMDDGDRS